jgi:hypothetical protein
VKLRSNPLVRMLVVLIAFAAGIRLAWILIEPVLIPMGILILLGTICTVLLRRQ